MSGLAVGCTLTLLFLLAGAVSAEDSRVVDLLWSPRGDRVAAIVASPGYQLAVVGRDGKPFYQSFSARNLRLFGWTPDGQGVVLDRGRDGLLVVFPDAGRSQPIPLEAGSVPLACDGTTVYYLSRGRSHLMAQTGNEQRVVAVLPSETRPAASLSPDGKHLALRRSVRTAAGYDTEVWVLSEGVYRRLARVPGSFVHLCWHPTKPGLLMNVPIESRHWDAYVAWLSSPEPPQLHPGLPSPAQWDREGRAYYASGAGLFELASGRAVVQWGESPSVWAVSPDGTSVVTSVSAGRLPVTLSALAR